MGKVLIQQARGKGSPTYKAPSFRYKGAVKHPFRHRSGVVVNLARCQGHSAPLAQLRFPNNQTGWVIAPEGIKVGQSVLFGAAVEAVTGNTLPLRDVPEGTLLYNIEGVPGDGGKFVRSAGGFAKLISKTPTKITVQLPSRKQKQFHPACRATLGIVAGGGRFDKPLIKAGSAYHKYRAKNKKYPIIGGSAQNAVDHPFGNKRTSRKSKARPVPRNAPPGRKVGYIRPRKTGSKKRK